MYIIRVCSIAALFMLTVISGCVGYPASYGNYGYSNYGYSIYGYRSYPSPQPYGARYPGPAAYGNYGSYGQSNYQNYQPYREHEGSREQEGYGEGGYNQGNRGYGQQQYHQDRD